MQFNIHANRFSTPKKIGRNHETCILFFSLHTIELGRFILLSRIRGFLFFFSLITFSVEFSKMFEEKEEKKLKRYFCIEIFPLKK